MYFEGDNLAQLWKDALEEWSLSEESLVTLTTDSASNMIAAATKNQWMRVPCFGHVLHNGVSKAMKISAVQTARG